MRVIFVVLVLTAGPVRGQTAVEQQRTAVQALMEQSLELQKRSVAVQLQNRTETPEGEGGFFTLPWPKPSPTSVLISAECEPLPGSTIERLVSDYGEREGVRPEVLREVMRRESGFRPCAVSKKGAQGLMQLMPATAQQFRVTDPFDPEQNVAAGARFLRKLLDRYAGDLSLALSAYNAGPGRVDEANGVPEIPETKSYVGAILRAVLLD